MHGVPLNTGDIKQALLNIEVKERSNPLPWNGQFSPQLIEVLLKTYSKADSAVLDPFAGSGTLLYEAAVCGLSAAAADINPAACYLARLYTLANKTPSHRAKLVAQLDQVIPQLLSSTLPLFGLEDTPDVKRERVQNVRRVIRDSELIEVLDALLVLSDFAKDEHGSREIRQTWNRLRPLILSMPYSSRPLSVFNCDARHIPMNSESIRLVITSPPYINVFNYHQNYRSSTEALGWNLLTVAKSEIGSNRKNRGNRFLTVVQYCLDLAQVFAELARVCEKNARVIFVVGRESQVLGVPFYNGEIIGALATRAAGCQLLMRQERVFRNRFGQNIYEDILHFVPASKTVAPSLDEARKIADGAMRCGLDSAKGDVAVGLKDAIERIYDVKPSPLYDSVAGDHQTKAQEA